MNDNIPLINCQRNLAIVWYIGSAILFVILLAQTFNGEFDGDNKVAWGWFYPTVLPTLLLITGAVISQASQANQSHTVKKFVYHLALYSSWFYLVLVLLSLVFTYVRGARRVDALSDSNLWLGPVQGLVGGVLGYFFTSSRSQNSAPEGG
jgi:hypothetical protein